MALQPTPRTERLRLNVRAHMRIIVVRYSKLIIQLTAIVFFIYGVGFVFAPELLSQTVTNSIPTSTSGIVDMRATYGGMSLAVGIFLFVLSRSEIRFGLLGVLLLMVRMAGARVYGLLVDGHANAVMYAYLALEVVVACIAVSLMARGDKNEL